MQLPRRVTGALGVVLLAGLVPGTPSPAAIPVESPVQRAGPACVSEGGTAAVRTPELVRQIATGETGWFSSPGLVDLDGDGRLEIVAPFYSTFVFDAAGRRLGRGTASEGRVYAPSVVTDLEGDGVTDIVVAGGYGHRGGVRVPRWRAPASRPGWPASTRSGGQSPEVRGIAAADLDGDGRVEVAVTTTNTSPTGAQVFVFDADGALFQPRGRALARVAPLQPARAGRATTCGSTRWATTATAPTARTSPSATSTTTPTWRSSPPSTTTRSTPSTSTVRRSSRRPGSPTGSPTPQGRRMGWGQFIRWADPRVERRHYHLHTGAWPSPARQTWLQWTASPPAVADLDGDGRNEVIGIPNVERHIPYRTQGYAFMVLDGAYGDGQPLGSAAPGLRDAADVEPSGPPTRR